MRNTQYTVRHNRAAERVGCMIVISVFVQGWLFDFPALSANIFETLGVDGGGLNITAKHGNITMLFINV